MSDIDIRALAILAQIAGARHAFDDAMEAYTHACRNRDVATVESARQRAIETLSILLNQIKAAHDYAER